MLGWRIRRVKETDFKHEGKEGKERNVYFERKMIGSDTLDDIQ